MALISKDKDHSVEVIEEYLAIANLCIERPKPSGDIWGYPATLLLLCAADAIGHGILPPNGQFTRLDVLAEPPFKLPLNQRQIGNLKDWYRNWLAHSGLIVTGVYLDKDLAGEPFGFDTSGALILIRVPVLYKVVSAAWEQAKRNFDPPTPVATPKRTLPDLSKQQPGFVSSLSSGASGRR